VSAAFTGRPTARAAIAASTTTGRGVPLEPKPPPTCGETTRTSSSSRPNTLAIVVRTAVTPCVESYSVSEPSPHTAVAACGSIGLLWSAAVS
jgi:hypothetical protein